jgi:glycosyltransferase involved in cell wall biosynthesis
MIDANPPRVSVVTPFYNSFDYLEQCIESVLRQSYRHLEYILVDNCSSDESLTIAERFAAKDSRIRLIKATEFRAQVENYNYALSLIDPQSRYCKIVQADDWIYPGCLEAMVEVAERHSSIGIVGAYSLRGKSLRGEGLPVEQWHVPGRAAGRIQMLEDKFFTGSPTTIMYRADLVRSRRPFYELDRYHEDTEVAYEIFRRYDLGFVHQVLSYQRVDSESIMGQRRSYQPHLLDRLIILDRFGKHFLSAEELSAACTQIERTLVRFLARSLMRGQSAEFWRYQEGGYRTMGRSLPRLKMFLSIVDQILDVVLNPKRALEAVLARLRRAAR